MPLCVTCGGEDFDVCDGLFYCSTCQTQTQDLRVEMEESAFVDMPSKSLLMKSKKSKMKTKKVVDKGRPWTLYEGYQFVLKAQVRALVMLGAHPKIDEVVFRLWALYLSKIEIAFCDDEKLVPVQLEKCARHRELYRGDMENPEVTPKRVIRAAKRAHRFLSKAYTETELLKSKLKDEEFYEGDNPVEESEKSYDLSSGEDFEKDETNPRTKKSMPSYLKYSEWMHLHKNLTFCLLGLMFTNSLTTAADLVRWIKEGAIPFMEVTSLLPSDIKLSALDIRLFKCEFPTASRLRYETARMAHFLGLEEFPPFPIEQLVSKYILHMDLPGELHGLVMNLVRQQAPRMVYYTNLNCRYGVKIPPYEAIAMSYIIITLKLCFGLDDHTERCLSIYSRKLLTVTTNYGPLFVFDDWKAHMTVKFRQHVNQTMLLSERCTMDQISDVNQVLETYSMKDPTKQRFGIQYDKKSLRKKKYNPEFRKAIRRPFLQLSEKWAQNQSIQDDQSNDNICTNEQCEDQSNDSFYVIKQYDEPMDILNESMEIDISELTPRNSMKDSDERGPKTQTESGDHFRQCTMRHITHPKEFIEGLNLDKRGLSTSHLNTSTSQEVQTDSSAVDVIYVSFENDDNKVNTDLSNETCPLKSGNNDKHSHPDTVPRVQDPLTTEVHPDGSTDMVGNPLMQDFVNAQESYILYDSKTSVDSGEYHQCYQWLLTVCAAMIESSDSDLTECINNLQSSLITAGALYVGTKQATCRQFIKKYIHSKQTKEKCSALVTDECE